MTRIWQCLYDIRQFNHSPNNFLCNQKQALSAENLTSALRQTTPSANGPLAGFQIGCSVVGGDKGGK